MELNDLLKIDRNQMYKTYDEWPNIARESFEEKFKKIDFKNIDHIVFAGMGGSGTIGDIFSAILSKNDIHVSIVKGYILPKTVDSNTLVVVTSISGNTSETLTVLENSLKTDAQIIALSSGGKMENLALKNEKISYFKIEQIHSPRASLVGFLYSTLNILQNFIPIKKSDINESLNELEIMQKKISSENLTQTNPALELAKWIDDIPIIYYPAGLRSVAIRFKNSLQENAKNHVITEDVIEACHNGIVAWERPSSLKPILIKGTNDFIKTKERWAILKEYFENKHIEYREINSNEGSILTKIVCLIYFLDYSSIYHAILLSTDPSPVSAIDFVKKKL